MQLKNFACVCVHQRACVRLRLRVSACVCTQKIKRPDASFVQGLSGCTIATSFVSGLWLGWTTMYQSAQHFRIWQPNTLNHPDRIQLSISSCRLLWLVVQRIVLKVTRNIGSALLQLSQILDVVGVNPFAPTCRCRNPSRGYGRSFNKMAILYSVDSLRYIL